MLQSIYPHNVSGRDAITLVPFSGIQFVDFGFDETNVRLSIPFWEEETNGPQDGADAEGSEAGASRTDDGVTAWYQLHRLEKDKSDGALFVPETHTVPDPSEIYSENLNLVLEMFLGHWVPVPIFRELEPGPGGQRRLDPGPTNWARARIVKLESPDEHGNSHRLILAFDTTLAERSDIRGYASPTIEDSGREDTFHLADGFEWISWFTSRRWMRDWLLRLDRMRHQARFPNRPMPERPSNPCRPFARYVAFVELINTAIAPPPLKLLDSLAKTNSQTSPSRTSIPVDLVLDIGNSRTCGVLIEDHPGSDGFDLSQSYPLELRDLAQPQHIYSDPFESRVEFSRADFGFAELNRFAGRGTAFGWGSLVRVGPEASRLAGSSVGSDGSTGMSSPKRYLWDTEERQMPWRFNGVSSETGAVEPIVSGPMMQYLTEAGLVRSTLRRRERRAGTPLFSRSSLFTLMLTEILQQALQQINSPASRIARRRPHEPRRLARVVMSLPPATPLPEIRIMRERARAAVALVWDMLKEEAADIDLPPRPEIDPKWDEASATQLVYLFSEIRHKFKGDMQTFFRLMGRQRDGIGESLRVASIDIGGGTSDLIVTTYTHEGGRAIIPNQEFRESFRLAGDDILQAVVERQVVSSIQQRLERDGLRASGPLLAGLFTGDRAGLSEHQRHKRRQFVTECLVPIGLALMHRTEEAGLGRDIPLAAMTWDEVFNDGLAPSDAVLSYLDDPISKTLGRKWSIRNTSFDFDIQALTNTIWGTMSNVLTLFAEAIHGLQCDVLLLSGRPSRLPAIQGLMLAQNAVPVDRVVTMHHYPAGPWYPFRDGLGRITDPKTTAVVGAALCELAGGQIQRFRVDSSRMTMRSTARYIGEMEQSGYIKNERLFFSDLDLDDPNPQPLSHNFQMHAPMEIGFRQLGIERWPATLLYRLAPSDRRAFQMHPTPWNCTIERGSIDLDAEDGEEQKEIFEISPEVTDRSGDPLTGVRVELKMQTLQSEQGYWLDTGILRLG